MPNAHPNPWHRSSLFGEGPRRALDREQRARYRYLLNAHRRAKRLTPLTEMVGNTLVRRLGVDGQCDPGHDTIANDAGCSTRTVRRALEALKALGLVVWQRRIVRAGWRVSQTSNAYLLVPSAAPPPPINPRKSSGGHSGHPTTQIAISSMPVASTHEVAEARTALARRRGVIESRLTRKS